MSSGETHISSSDHQKSPYLCTVASTALAGRGMWMVADRINGFWPKHTCVLPHEIISKTIVSPATSFQQNLIKTYEMKYPNTSLIVCLFTQDAPLSSYENYWRNCTKMSSAIPHRIRILPQPSSNEIKGT